MKYSIKAKMTLLVALIIVVMMGGMLLASFFLAEPVMIRIQKKQIRDLYSALDNGYSDDADVLQGLVESYERQKNLRVEIFDGKGSLIYTTGRRMDEGFDGFRGVMPELPGRIEGGWITVADYAVYPSVERVGIGNSDMLTLHGRLELADGSVRYVSVETPVEAISSTVNVLNRLTLIISVLVALGGCLAAWLYAGRFSKPIVAVSRTARQVAALDFSHRAEEESSTAEIADLAVSINAMSQQLEGFIRQLMEKNRQLAEDNLRLEKEEEMRRSFVANVSHDLKSPLAVLGGYAEMLKEHTEGIDPEACYDVIIEETAVMDEMIRSMLDVSALENGLCELKTVPLELKEWLGELIARERPLMEKKGLRVEVTMEQELTVAADPDYLARAVLNICENAQSHTSDGGVVSFRLERAEKEAVVSVYNQGAPIPEEKLGKIWESFYRTDEARTRTERHNVGLGLYIVKTIVAAHGGRCGAVNEADGVRFWLSLPMSNE